MPQASNGFGTTALLFDLDGTLIESASLVGDILNSMRLEKGLAPLGSDRYRVWSSRGGSYLVGHALEAGPESVGPLLDEFRRRYHELPTPMESVFPGARELLERLTDAGRLLAICSNKPQRLCHKLLDETGLIRFFGAIVGGDTLDKSKPDPTPLTYALSRLGGETDTALMIGDSAVDQRTADAAGVRFAFFTGGYDDARRRIACSMRLAKSRRSSNRERSRRLPRHMALALIAAWLNKPSRPSGDGNSGLVLFAGSRSGH